MKKPLPTTAGRTSTMSLAGRLTLLLALLLAAVISAQPSPSSPAAREQPPPSELDFEREHTTAPRARTLASSPHRAAPNLPDSIRDFRFNAPAAPVSHHHPADSDGDEHPRYGEPTIDDLTLSPLVLVVTVDGQVHALKRDTGHWVWTLHDDGGLALGGASAQERQRRAQAGGVVGSPLINAMGRKKAAAAATPVGFGRARSNETSIAEVAPSDDEDEDEVYVIEPFSQGDIYLFTRDPTSSGGGSLEKLPLSMQQLVSLSPFTFPSDSSRMFVGRKETNLVGVDLRTGRLVGVFGSGAGWCEWDESRQGIRNEEECDEEISRRPEDLLYMARTEYHLSIYAKSSSSLLQTLTYTTYTSSSLGGPLQEQWTATPDGRYLQPMHDGSLLCFLTGKPGLQWAIAFDHPVVSIFDIALPPQNDGVGGEKGQPLMFEQPHSLPVQGMPRDFDGLSKLPDTTFIGKIGDNLFAMSRDNFPLVALSPAADVNDGPVGGIGGTWDRVEEDPTDEDYEDEGEEEGMERSPEEAGETCRGTDCLLGRHFVHRSHVTPIDAAIDPPADRLRIEAPPPSQPQPRPTSSPSSPHAPGQSSDLASLYRPIRLSSAKSVTLATALLMLLGYLCVRKFVSAKTQGNIEERVKALGDTLLSVAKPFDGKLDASLPPTPINTSRAPTPLPAAPTVEDPTSRPTSPSPDSPPSLAASLISSSAPSSPRTPGTRSRSASVASPPLESKELPPIPALTELDDGEGDSDGETKEGVEGTPKRRGRRRRGKKPKKGLKTLEDAAAIAGGATTGLFPEGEPTEKDLKGLTLGAAEVKEDVAEIETIPVISSEPQMIGGLTVSETILGYGSHGTVVLRGEFQGRAVAVKRLLKDFVTIATHEVALLQESDDHPHVIRYFCKEQRDTFLYIALELCPASLFDLIDQPSTFPDLVRDLDSKRALRQITGGIRHLHKLKIVHRDIKPQNILVSTSKHGGVRMLISDFGLCKKLDVDESSFQQTVNHAAGSFGYRAPEVLRGQVDPNGGASSPLNGTADSRSGTVQSLTSGVSVNPDPSMRLTRSIDIFSLGCIFYYVLTGGEHPFGGRYEREMNILRGKISLEQLDGLGEEALEVQDLITRMVASDPRERPSAEAVLLHPFFWNSQKRLLFLCDASDRFEIMERDPPDATLVLLEETAGDIVGDDWQKAIDRTLLDNLGKYRKYDGRSVRDLLRVLRNKKHHYQDLPEPVRKNLGDLPGGFLSYFTTRFPRLLLHVYDTVATNLSDEPMFASTFRVPDDEH
ncbi:serine/threonine-protein kinase/endoribonuclease IRE1 [Pseudohyphozyma bogoriensis]|nr:serine/threonine-protein kinase/endoribonuclease IRE1 [Pseudohyphozyma bogoriensis]